MSEAMDLDGHFRLRRDPPRGDGLRYFAPCAGTVDEPTGLFLRREDAERARDRLPDAEAWQVHTRAECRRLDVEAAATSGRA